MTHRERMTGPQVWQGNDLESQTDWLVEFTPDLVEELDSRLEDANAVGLTVPFKSEEFPLDSCAALLDEVVELLDSGPGFAVVRGLPRSRYSNDECELIYWAFGVHLGTPVSQNSQGHVLGHVRDTGKSMDDPNVRSYQTNTKLDFHADQLPVDVLGLFCMRTALRGGRSKVVSAMTIHNVIKQERPDLLEVLYAPFNLDWRGEEPKGEQPWYQLPMFSEANGKLASRFTSLAYFRTVSRHGEELTMTPEQAEALDLAQEIANRPGMAISMELEEGDMQFLNNHTMLHARESYEDHADPEYMRHLLRMWIAYPPNRRQELSPLLAERYRYVETGGIPVKQDTR